MASAHDVREGGLFITLAESGFPRELGFRVGSGDVRKDAFWFGEAQSRVVVSVSKDKEGEFLALAKGVAVTKLGVVTDGRFAVDGEDWGHVGDWKRKYDGSLAAHMEKLAEMDTL